MPNLGTVGDGAWTFYVATRSQHLVTTLKDLVLARKSEGHVLALDQEILWRTGSREFEVVLGHVATIC